MVDTNVVIYAYDPEESGKHEMAQGLVKRLSDAGGLVFIAQVFNEFCSVMMSPRRKPPLSVERIVQILRRLAATGEVVLITPSMTFRALDAIPRHGLSFWDALIWAAARENGGPVIYTEDFQSGRDVEGVRFLNPFVIASGA